MSFSEGQIAKLKAAFGILDKDGDGTLGTKELGSFLSSLGQSTSDDEVEALIKEYDADGSGKIDFDEFLIMISKKCTPNELEAKLKN